MSEEQQKVRAKLADDLYAEFESVDDLLTFGASIGRKEFEQCWAACRSDKPSYSDFLRYGSTRRRESLPQILESTRLTNGQTLKEALADIQRRKRQ